MTDRYTKAVDQLGPDKLDERIGGIYALERVARDSFTDHPIAMEVLAAFIREHLRAQWSPLEARRETVQYLAALLHAKRVEVEPGQGRGR